jgi:hypothetical protein
MTVKRGVGCLFYSINVYDTRIHSFSLFFYIYACTFNLESRKGADFLFSFGLIWGKACFLSTWSTVPHVRKLNLASYKSTRLKYMTTSYKNQKINCRLFTIGKSACHVVSQIKKREKGPRIKIANVWAFHNVSFQPWGKLWTLAAKSYHRQCWKTLPKRSVSYVEMLKKCSYGIYSLHVLGTLLGGGREGEGGREGGGAGGGRDLGQTTVKYIREGYLSKILYKNHHVPSGGGR